MRSLAWLLPFLVAGCASGPPPRVSLSDAWPSEPPGWSSAREHWTRRASQTTDFLKVVDVAATLESPAWRAAYVRERARRLHLPADEEARLAEAQRQAAAEAWEVEIVIATGKNEWNDLRKGALSMWRVSLASADGREVLPISLVEDRRPRGELSGWFPDLEPFYQPYIARFPKVTPDGKPLAAGSLTLKVRSAVGGVELTWAE